jgi:hypothetical protein
MLKMSVIHNANAGHEHKQKSENINPLQTNKPSSLTQSVLKIIAGGIDTSGCRIELIKKPKQRSVFNLLY